MSTLEEKLTALAQARAAYEARKATLDAAKADWENANRDLLESVAQLKADMNAADEAVRDEALKAYGESLDTKPADGVTIKQYTVIRAEEPAVRAWAMTYMPALLVPDMKAFEQIRRAVLDHKALADVFPVIPGTVVIEPRVTVASNLSQYLSLAVTK
jgi:hypothetical protein